MKALTPNEIEGLFLETIEEIEEMKLTINPDPKAIENIIRESNKLIKYLRYNGDKAKIKRIQEDIVSLEKKALFVDVFNNIISNSNLSISELRNIFKNPNKNAYEKIGALLTKYLENDEDGFLMLSNIFKQSKDAPFELFDMLLEKNDLSVLKGLGLNTDTFESDYNDAINIIKSYDLTEVGLSNKPEHNKSYFLNSVNERINKTLDKKDKGNSESVKTNSKEANKEDVDDMKMTFEELFRNKEYANHFKNIIESEFLTDNGIWGNNESKNILAKFYYLLSDPSFGLFLLKKVKQKKGLTIFYKEFGLNINDNEFSNLYKAKDMDSNYDKTYIEYYPKLKEIKNLVE